MTLARFPNTIYKGSIKIFITYILPIAFMTTVPSSIFVWGINYKLIGISLFITIIFGMLALLCWNLGLKAYKGASS